MKKAGAHSSQFSTGQIRIIGGQWRGRKLSFPNLDGLRPTGDRIRETLFNWLMPFVEGTQVVDLFAGSGALGIEALSRGAASAKFIESNATAAEAITNNLAILKSSQAQVYRQNALSWLNTQPAKSIDILFLDPPFSQHLHNQTFGAVNQQQVMRDNGLIYIEMPKNETVVIPANWSIEKEKSSGDLRYLLCQYKV